jgi:hypothetical protein
VLLVVGGLLVVHPFFLPVGELASPDPVYERTELTITDGQVDWERGTAAVPWRGLDCIEDPEDYRRCVLEQALVEESITVPAYRSMPDADPYVALPSGFYRRTSQETEAGFRYNLTRVSGETVLQEIAVSPEQVPPRLVPAARGDTAVVESQIDETYVIRDRGEFFLITRTATRSLPLDDFYGPLSAIGFILGAGLLVWSGRTFDRA